MKFAHASAVALLAFSCSSTPAPSKAPSSPDWIRQAARTFDGSTLVYVGSGEDRTSENALFKSEAMALQDLENECSLIPKSTNVQADHFQEQAGLIFRAFTRVSISMADCEAAKKALTLDQLHEQASPQLTGSVESYQQSYDAPEPEENAPLTEKSGSTHIGDSSQLFILRQQVALAQQKIILSQKASSSPEDIVQAKKRIVEFEKTNPTSQAFSIGRPNWINHQASAVRETIPESAQLKKEYSYTPNPMAGSGKKAPASRGKGSRRRGQQPPQQSPDAAPSPIPTL